MSANDQSPNSQQSWSLDILRCPITGEALRLATAELLQSINRRIDAGQMVTQAGEAVKEPLEAAVINASQTWLYRYRDNVFNLLPQDAIGI